MSDFEGPGLALSQIGKSYNKLEIVRDVSLDLPRGALLTLLGPSGCGKTTLLRIVAGFVEGATGEVRIDGASVGHLPPERRPTSIMFQSYGLFPHMTVFDNVAFGPRLRGVRGAKLKAEILKVLDLVHLADFTGRYPSELSGGQQQRAALARSLVVQPKVLLLDEPFAALDRNLRERMQVELRKLQQQLGITMLVVTHDQHEALVLSDYVAVMNKGRLEQFAPPNTVYDHPATRFVAGFMGIPNLIEGALIQEGSRLGFQIPGFTLPIKQPCRHGPDAKACLAFRPENVAVTQGDTDAGWPGIVRFVRPIGNHITCEIETAAGLVTAALPRSQSGLALGNAVRIAVDPERCTVLYQ